MLNNFFGKNNNSIKSGSVSELLYPSKVEKKVEKTISNYEQQPESTNISDLELKAISSPDSLNGLTEDQLNTLPTELQSVVRDTTNLDNKSSGTENNNLSELKPDQLLPLFELFVANLDFSKFTTDEIPKESLTEDQTLAYNDSIETLKTNITELKKLGFHDLAKSFDSALKKLGIESVNSEGEISNGEILNDKNVRIIKNKFDPESNAKLFVITIVPAIASYSAVMLYYIAPTVFTIGASAGLGALTVKYIKSKIEEHKSNHPEPSVKPIEADIVQGILYPQLASKQS
jgi:hypothetical protein